MKGFRFYAELPESRGSKSASKANPLFPWTVAALRERSAAGFKACVTAVYLQDNGRPQYNASGMAETVAAAIDGNHHSYGYTSASRDYLAKRCTRIPEDLARALSPELFAYLES
jgi:hypothetical protein